MALSPLKEGRAPIVPLEISFQPTKEIDSSRDQPLVIEMPPLTVEQEEQGSRTPQADSRTSLVFDQPLLGTPTQPAHEVKRRISLHAALGSDRRSTNITRLVSSGASRRDRRQTLLFPTLASVDSSSRRHTLHAIYSTADSPQQPDESPDGSMLDESKADGDVSCGRVTESDSTLVVDVGMNLDIFAQKPTAKLPAAAKTAVSLQPPRAFEHSSRGVQETSHGTLDSEETSNSVPGRVELKSDEAGSTNQRLSPTVLPPTIHESIRPGSRLCSRLEEEGGAQSLVWKTATCFLVPLLLR